MKSSIIGIVLIAAAAILGYMGIQKVQSSSASVKVLGIEIEAEDNSGKEQGYIYLGLAVVLLAGGVYTLNGGKKG
jgi:hypothetical protein